MILFVILLLFVFLILTKYFFLYNQINTHSLSKYYKNLSATDKEICRGFLLSMIHANSILDVQDKVLLIFNLYDFLNRFNKNLYYKKKAEQFFNIYMDYFFQQVFCFNKNDNECKELENKIMEEIKLSFDELNDHTLNIQHVK